jgi:hypothetical protein
MTRARRLAFLLGVSVLGACAAPAPDYGSYLEHMPRSILVLPPLNLTTDVDAGGAFLSTISRPLAECGYYVYPVAVVEAMMQENGLPTPADMHQVPPAKLAEVFDADAVLYIVIQDWTTRYAILDTSTVVTLDYRLVDLKSSTELWHQKVRMQQSSSAGSRSPLEMMVGALVTAIAKSVSTPERGVAVQANTRLFADSRRGLLKGPHHPEFSKEQEQRRKGKESKPAAPAPDVDGRPEAVRP